MELNEALIEKTKILLGFYGYYTNKHEVNLSTYVTFFKEKRPDNSYSVLDTNRTSLTGSGGCLQVVKQNGNWNFMGISI